MFSSFMGVCFAVKSKSTVKHLLLIRKFFSKTQKMVYEIFFRKPFSNLLPTPHPTLLLSLSLSPNPYYCSPSPYLLSLAEPPSLLLLSIVRKQSNIETSLSAPALSFFDFARQTPTPLSSHFADLVVGCGGSGCSWLVGF